MRWTKKEEQAPALPPCLPKCNYMTLEDRMDVLVLRFENAGTDGEDVKEWREPIDPLKRPDGFRVFRGGAFREAFIKEMAGKVTDSVYPGRSVGIEALKKYRSEARNLALSMQGGYGSFLTAPRLLADKSRDIAELVDADQDLPWAMLIYESVVQVLHSFSTNGGNKEINEAKITAEKAPKKPGRGRPSKNATRAKNAKQSNKSGKSEKQPKTKKTKS
ncbi:MAG: hypothetical protein IKE76_09405 [Clostridia bacterium]|nr:hypothetical protein [Clostridia bacterium]